MPPDAIYLSAPAALCCAGTDRERFFDTAVRGEQGGIRPLFLADGRRFLAGQISGELPVPDISGEDRLPEGLPDSKLLRIINAALEQIRPEIEEAAARYGKQRIGVCLGSCDNGSEWSLAAHCAHFEGKSFPPGYELRFQGPAWPAEYIARRFSLEGPVLAISTACASSAGALVKGAELIRSGFCDAVIAGGADIVSEIVLLGFDSLELISAEVCNPFSKNRKGITLGEGAAFFVLSQERGEEGIALLGAGESADAFHITSPREDGSGAAVAMKAALEAAGIDARELGYVNLHGTGTDLNDSMEALAVAAVFSGLDCSPPVSSTKPVTGHTLGAAGALELALCWMALHRGGGYLPVHCWDGVRDESAPLLRFVEKGTASPGLRYCMSNSFAFGGCNTSLIIGREN